MSQSRFLLGFRLTEEAGRQLLAAVHALALRIAVDRDGILLAIDPALPCLMVPDAGCILGRFFALNETGPCLALSDRASEMVRRSDGRSLARTHWGDYLAILPSRRDILILRAPFGAIPCLLKRHAGGLLVGSSTELMRTAGMGPSTIAFDLVARQLAEGDTRHSDTCIEGISELRGGDLWRLSDHSVGVETFWTPWEAAADRDARCDGAEARRDLYERVIGCVAARSSHIRKPLLMLSGGLDSSIVAASLAAIGKEFVSFNAVTTDAAGDERTQAGIVAQAFRSPIVCRRFDASHATYRSYGAQDLPRPSARSLEQHVYHLAEQVAAEHDCDGIADGGGGDNVFCSLKSVAFAADCLLDHRGHEHFFRMCGDIGAVAQVPAWHVACRALARAARRQRDFRWPVNRHFLAPPSTSSRQPFQHPWLENPGDALPGRAAHVAQLIALQGYTEDGRYGSRIRAVSPLVSQPLIEHCLRIASWHWYGRERGRYAARLAFDGSLPTTIAWRPDKGAPDSFVLDLVARNRQAIRNDLVDGVLAGGGILDIDAIADCLESADLASSSDLVRIMRLMDAESWARRITGHSAMPGA